MRWPRSADAVLAILVLLASLFLSSEGPNQDILIRTVDEVTADALIILMLAGVALYWRKSHPLTVLGIILASLILLAAFDYSYDLYGLPVALYSVARYVSNDRWSDIALGASISVAAISELIVEGPLEDIVGAFISLFLVWFIGRRIRIRGEYLNLLQERAAQLEREQASESRRSVAEERTRIARELHDVVAHQVSLMTVQAGAAKTVVADDPEGALRAMEAVEQAGRKALNELRHLLGVLRPEVEVDQLGPQPGVSDIPRLVEHLKEAGLDISLLMDDVPTELPARVDLSVYRIVQEALTNVLKHAGPNAKTTVQLSTDNEGIVIEVLDNGCGASISPGSGHGITGMRERTQLLAGSLDAGPRADGGFQVIAHFPIEEKSF